MDGIDEFGSSFDAAATNSAGGWDYGQDLPVNLDMGDAGGVTYESVFPDSFWSELQSAYSGNATQGSGGENSVWAGPSAEDEKYLRPMENKSTLSQIEDLLKENPSLAKFGMLTGAGFLKSLGQQQAQREQQEWIEKRDKEEWDRKLKANRYATHTPQFQTGLLTRAVAQRGAQK